MKVVLELFPEVLGNSLVLEKNLFLMNKNLNFDKKKQQNFRLRCNFDALRTHTTKSLIYPVHVKRPNLEIRHDSAILQRN